MGQTAVSWFFDNLKNHEIQAEHFELYQQAKAMEKAQIDDAYNRGKKEHTVSSKPISKTWGFLGEENNNNERRNRSW